MTTLRTSVESLQRWLLIFSLAACASLQAADHRDAPRIAEDGRADLLDVYAFVNPNNSNVVFAATVNPFVIGGALQVAFSPDVLYQFKIDNDNDNKEDLVIQAVFTPTVPGPQMVTILGPAKPRVRGPQNLQLNEKRVLNFTGPANGTIITTNNGMRAFAGLRDDPFFIDLIWVLRLLGLQPGGPITSRDGGIDFFEALNASIVAVEVPPNLLRGESGNVIRVWGTTSRSRVTVRSPRRDDADDSRVFVQIDRTALPVINTVLIPPARKDEFNRAVPAQDRELFRATAIASLVGVNGNATHSAIIADLLLPDVLTLDMSNTSGFLNGRRPQDDVIDTVLGAASKGAVTTDNVDANDVPFLPNFPFFAPPHAASKEIPGRN